MSAASPARARFAVLQVVPWYAPRSWGGTEQFVQSLCTALPVRGIHADVAVVDGRFDAPAVHAGVRVWRVDDSGVDAAAAGVIDAARRSGAQLVNLHAWTPLTGAHLVAALGMAGLRCVVSLHVPTLLCARGTMLRHGRTPCDGAVRVRRCTACWLRAKGMPSPFADTLAALPPDVAAWAADRMPRWRARTALRATSAMQQRRVEVADFSRTVDHVVVPAQWFADALLRNGMHRDRVTVCRPGVDHDWLGRISHVEASPREAGLEVLFVGRWDAVKGLEVLFEAAARIAGTVDIRVTVCCTEAADEDAQVERARLLRRWTGAPWLRLVEGASREQLAVHYRNSDVVAIPSRCLETGPIVALEALAAGCTVFGSAFGGIQELLQHRDGNRLLPFDDPAAWAQALGEAARAPRRTRMPGAPVRDGGAVADEMAAVYRRVLDRVSP